MGGRSKRGRPHGSAQIGCKGEKWSRNRLCGTIAGEECVIADPAAWNNFLLQQWQDDVPAAKYQRAGPIETVDKLYRLIAGRAGEQRETNQECEKNGKCPDGDTATKRDGQMRDLVLPSRWQPEQSNHAAEDDDGNLRHRRGQDQGQHRGPNSQRHAFAVRTKSTGHPPHRLRDDGNGDDHEAV